MSVVEEYEFVDDAPVQEQKEYDQDLYKKVTRAKDIGRFVAVRPLFDIGKVIVDIGQFDANNKLVSSSICYLDMIKFGAYLRAVTNGNAENIYVPDKWNMMDTVEGLTVFGGSGEVARIFKAGYWPAGDGHDKNNFQWKVGHFKGTKQGPGIIKPDFKAILSSDSIKVTRQDVAEISYALDTALVAHASRNPKWYYLKRD